MDHPESDSPSARELVEQIWQRAEGELVVGVAAVSELLEFERPEHNADLRYLNSHWSIDPAADAPAGAEWKAKAKDRFAETVLGVLHRYFEQERDFFAHGVRVHNAMAGWCGRLAREIRAVATSMTDESRRLSERQDVLHRRLEDRIAELEARLAEVEGTSR